LQVTEKKEIFEEIHKMGKGYIRGIHQDLTLHWTLKMYKRRF